MMILALAGLHTSQAYAFNVGDVHSWQFEPSISGQAVATNVARKLLPALVFKDDPLAQRLGFKNASEVEPNQLLVTRPYPVFVVSLRRLIQYDPGVHSPIWLLMGSTNFLRNPSPFPARFLFPTITPSSTHPPGPVKTSILVHMPPNSYSWKLFRIGSPDLIKALTAYGSAPQYFVVSIPGLDRYYLGKVEGPLLKIKAVFRDPIGMEAGDEHNAELVFVRLKPEAMVAAAAHAPRY
jgi:hypothetical protein